MSYNGDRSCRNHFSRLQIAVMLRTIKHKKIDHTYWDNNSFIYDDFEPDNNTEMARTITLNEIQEHNFHQQHEYNGWGPTTTQCDVDWVRFTPVCSGNFTIETSAITGRTNANTRLTLFDNALSQLAQNDDISGSNLYSSINYNFTTGTTYFIRVENMSTGTTGYYQLGIKYTPTITGPDAMCVPTSYQISNLPSGGAVTWTTSPAGIVTPNTITSNPATFTQVSSGSLILTAQMAACGANFSASKSIIVGAPSAVVIQQYSNLDVCPESEYFRVLYSGSEYSGTLTAIAAGGGPATSSTWSLAPFTSGANWSWVPSGNTVSVSTKRANAYLTLRHTVSNACGSVYKDFFFTSGDCLAALVASPGEEELSIAPNPATTSVTLSLKTDAKDKSIEEVVIQSKAGREVKRLKITGNTKLQVINISDLLPDVYMIQVYDGEKWINKKMIKQ